MEKLCPLMVKLVGKNVVIIGGGNVALRKARGLAASGARITVVSPAILPELQTLPNVEWRQKYFEREDIQNAHLIYAATNHREINQSVAQFVEEWQWFNDTSSPANSNFYTPAVIQGNDIVVSISTGGRDPSKAKKLKHRLMAFLQIKDNTIL